MVRQKRDLRFDEFEKGKAASGRGVLIEEDHPRVIDHEVIDTDQAKDIDQSKSFAFIHHRHSGPPGHVISRCPLVNVPVDSKHKGRLAIPEV